jgi:hypothetical protein
VLGIREDHLSVYLNDHLAGATVGVNLAGNLARKNPSLPVLGDIAREIEEDRATLVALMGLLSVGEDHVKEKLAWAAEKASRLKFQGEILGYSALSRFEELETLALGVEGKHDLWMALQHTHGGDPRLRSIDFDHLIERARSQRERLEALRLRAADEALA